jgi:alpha-glucosidase (family GH31 glycosyl hydrolase)
VFEYDVTPDRAHQPLYGAVPLMLSHTKDYSAGLLWLNAAETMVDVEDGSTGKDTHWFSESGIIDLFILSAANPIEVQGQYALLTGTQFMPPLFSLGYHQCRWNYKDEADVKQVDAKFDEQVLRTGKNLLLTPHKPYTRSHK